MEAEGPGSESVSKGKPEGFAAQLGVAAEAKQRVKGDWEVFVLSNWVDRVAIYDTEAVAQEQVSRGIQSSVCDVLNLSCLLVFQVAVLSKPQSVQIWSLGTRSRLDRSWDM